jgi:hypothetical protein
MASHIPELYEDASKLHSLLCIHVDKATEKPDATWKPKDCEPQAKKDKWRKDLDALFSAVGVRDDFHHIFVSW